MITQKEIDVEVWELVDTTKNLYISNMGRVKRIYKNKRERMLKPYLRKGVPPYFIKVNKKEVKVAQLVWKAFHGDYDTRSYSLIHTGLKTDDRLVNLTLLSKQEAGSMFGSRSRRRGIYKVDPENWNVLAFYKSSREAAAKEYCSYQTILDSCNGKTRRNATGYSFVWSEVVDDSSEKINTKGKIKRI